MDDLCNLVATIMAERFAFTMLFDNYLPRAMAYKRFLEETKGVDPARFSAPEKDYILDKFDPEMELVNRYMDQARFSQRGGRGLRVCVCVCSWKGVPRDDETDPNSCRLPYEIHDSNEFAERSARNPPFARAKQRRAFF